jgi:cytoskeletal protein CcmA (bactofilin family)
MGLFSSNEKKRERTKKFKAPTLSTVIGVGTEITGDLHFSGGLHVDGQIKGNVTAEQDGQSALIVSENGTIEGEVRVPNMLINGTVNGDLYASMRVELASDARIHGTVYYSMLEMAMGAEVNGQMIRTDEDSPKMLGYEEEETETTELD